MFNADLYNELILKIKRNKKIAIAVDFDGVLVEDKFPNIGPINKTLLILLQRLRGYGCAIILHTCRADVYRTSKEGNRTILPWLYNAILVCSENGLEFDAINENVVEVKDLLGKYIEFHGLRRKLSVDLFLEDKNPTWDLKETCDFLERICEEFKEKERTYVHIRN